MESTSLSVSQLSITLQSLDGSRDTTEKLTFPAPQLKSIQAVQPGDTLRISFFVHTLSSEITTKNGAEEEGDPARPHQAMLELALKNNPEIRVLRVLKSLNSGKHKLDLKFKESEPVFQQFPGIYRVRVILGSFDVARPLIFELGGDLNVNYPILSGEELRSVVQPSELDEKLSAMPEKEEFSMQPEIHHVFRSAEVSPSLGISAAFIGICLSPWLFLLYGWNKLQVNYDGLNTKVQMSAGLTFLANLVGFVMLNYFYWTQLRLPQTLLYLTGLGVNAIFVGRKVLSEIAQNRVKSAKKE